jgi:Zn-dependent protease
MNLSVADILQLVLSLVATFAAVILHEVAHGYVSWRLGDPTPKQQGRLTANPLAHIDLIGSIVVPLALWAMNSRFLFGWAKPVPINPAFYRNPLKGTLYVALAGPLSNVAAALAAAGTGRLVLLGISGSVLFRTSTVTANLVQAVFLFLGIFVIINLALAVFNLIPIPPLDGSRVLAYFLPAHWRLRMAQIERFGFLIIFALVLLGGTSGLFRLTSGIWRALLGNEWLLFLSS